MPRPMTLGKMLAALIVAAVSVLAGGRVSAESQGSLSIAQVQSGPESRPRVRKRLTMFLKDWLAIRGHERASVIPLKDGRLAIWTRDDTGTALAELPDPAAFGIHPVDDEAMQSSDATVPLQPGYVRVSASDDYGPRIFVIRAAPVIDRSHIAEAAAGIGVYGSAAQITFSFTPEGTRLFGDLTRNSIGHAFAIVVDDEVVSAPVIREPILGGKGQISGNFSIAEAQELALRIGAPPELAGLTILATCLAARPRAPPSWAPKWIVPAPSCD